jgi:hypothetical protein
MSCGTQLWAVTTRSAWSSLYSTAPNTSWRRASSRVIRSRNAAPWVCSRWRMISYVALPNTAELAPATADRRPRGIRAGRSTGAAFGIRDGFLGHAQLRAAGPMLKR